MKKFYTLFTALAFISINAQTTVNLTVENGFSNGALYNQAGWNSSFTATTCMVDTSNGHIELGNLFVNKNRKIISY